MDKETMTIKGDGIKEQALQALTNFKAIVEGAGSSLDKVAKTLVSRASY